MLDSKAMSLSKFVGSDRLFCSPFSNAKQVASVKSSPQFSSCTGTSPKASVLSSAKKFISSVVQEKFGVDALQNHINGTNGASSSLLSRKMKVLDAFDDEYGGVIVISDRLPAIPEVFALRLHLSLSQWKIMGKKGVWLKLPLERSELVPVAVKEGFQYHHAEQGYVMLTYWLPEGPCMLPANASHQVGVGGFVINDKNEVLVVQEKHYAPALAGLWKIPTGFILESEEIFSGAVREVKEETGYLDRGTPRYEERERERGTLTPSGTRHAHNVAFEKSDLFFICMLRPLSTQILVDDLEIQAAKWMPLVDFLEQPLIQEDRMFKKILDICIRRLGKRYCGLAAHRVISKFDGKPSSLYYNVVEDEDFNCQAY